MQGEKQFRGSSYIWLLKDESKDLRILECENLGIFENMFLTLYIKMNSSLLYTKNL